MEAGFLLCGGKEGRMPRGNNKKNTMNAAGAGTIRKKTVSRNGKEYTYWEARYTTGYDPGTGKQIQKSVTGKTQKEVAEKLREVTSEIDQGTYIEPSKMKLGQWLDIWSENYLGDVKPYTVASYSGLIRNHIKPALGNLPLGEVPSHVIQMFYNSLTREDTNRKPLSAKTVKNIHGVLHKALQQAVQNGYIRNNPTEACKLPRIIRKEFHPLDKEQMSKLLAEIEGHRYEILYTVTLFTGMREGEAIGLTWDCVDFKHGKLTVNKQLQREKKKGARYVFSPVKNGKTRVIVPAPWVMQLLKKQKAQQAEWRLRAGSAWDPGDFANLVFTDELGHFLWIHNVYRDFKKVVASIGLPNVRVHDLRHSYAVASIQAGDDIKTVQSNLGHTTAAFTLDVYGHVTDQMKEASAQRMEDFIKEVVAK